MRCLHFNNYEETNQIKQMQAKQTENNKAEETLINE